MSAENISVRVCVTETCNCPNLKGMTMNKGYLAQLVEDHKGELRDGEYALLLKAVSLVRDGVQKPDLPELVLQGMVGRKEISSVDKRRLLRVLVPMPEDVTDPRARVLADLSRRRREQIGLEFQPVCCAG